MELKLLPETLAVCRLPTGEPLPSWLGGGFYSVTVTPSEVSVVCEEARLPGDIQAERAWRCLKVKGTLEFSLVGILASLLTPLADSGISVFALSTFETDYLLIKQEQLAEATLVLRRSGHLVEAEARA